MIYPDFVSDMAVEAANLCGLADITKRTEMPYGIVHRYMNVKSTQLAERIGRARGVYITLDCPRSVYDDVKRINALTAHLSSAIKGLLGSVRKSTPVLVIGLGNGGVVADALGKRVVEGINVTKSYLGQGGRQKVCAITTGVFGTTGIQSTDVASAITDKIKPCAAILIDSLATSCVDRLGTSFQISTAGISPGSGVGQDKDKIDKSVLGVPVIAIGVPLMLSMRTAVYNFIKDYNSQTGAQMDEYRLRAAMTDRGLSNLVVAPKEIDYLVDASGAIIASSLNRVFGN